MNSSSKLAVRLSGEKMFFEGAPKRKLIQTIYGAPLAGAHNTPVAATLLTQLRPAGHPLTQASATAGR